MTFSEWWKANKYRMLGKVWTEDACRETWQAADRQALERAAERCMSVLGYPPSEYYAKAIRELMEPK
ncbi:hypothetical protein [Caballeronia sp. ATUFL_M1_KS5A]|uniref:hypothetical protein n=1 Tax=Caballeronia sp. ATUFL_M1_KS5A TaxID=2921778 RepID=UPI0020285040|nr:hypothetical protein [Caballeronia sp. ATUFL_M1_KS5A]